jgi:hypothetical protein
MLCVLFGHALLVWLLIQGLRPVIELKVDIGDPLVPDIIYVPVEAVEETRLPAPRVEVELSPPQLAKAEDDAKPDAAPGESEALTQRGYTDWPKEGKDAATRVLAREAESQRLARTFAGPQGTWASLTKRQRDELNHFRWKPGIDGLERDEKGNTIYHVSEGCSLVNFSIIACAIGKKPPAYGDMFKDMRLYFDEQRRPRTDEGNGREPESMRAPYWSKQPDQ